MIASKKFIKEVTNMTSKRKQILSVVTSIALAMILCLGMALPAFAASYSEGTDSTNPAQAAITKVFKMPKGTPTPESKFVFVFEKVGMNDPLDTTKNNGMPDINGNNTIDVNFDSGEEPAGGTFINGDTKSVVKESANFLDGMIGSSYWGNGEGIYIYKVYEAQRPASYITLTGAEQEGEYFSEAVYTVEIWVEADENDILFPKYVAVKITENVDEYYEDGTEGDEKVDPTPGGPKEKPGDPTIDDDFSQVIFTNKYWASDGGGTTDPTKTALEIEKKIRGNGADTTLYFDFNVTVTQPSVIKDQQIYKAYVFNTNNQNVTNIKNYADLDLVNDQDYNGYFIEFKSGEEKVISLTNNQRLVFVDLHVASNVEVWEDAADGYTARYVNSFGDNAGTEYKATAANMNWGYPLNSADAGSHIINAGNNNLSSFTNNRTGAAPMGISMENLPFVILIGFGVLALAGFAVFSFRKRTKNEA
jgi:hypothetical protein